MGTVKKERVGRADATPTLLYPTRQMAREYSSTGLTDAVRFKGLWKAKPPVGPGHVEPVVVVGGLRDGLHVVVRVVTEVRNDIRGGVDPGRRHVGHPRPTAGAGSAGIEFEHRIHVGRVRVG